MALRKRSWLVLAAGVAATTLVAGCGNAGANAGSTPGAIQGTIQMSYWGSSSRVAKTNSIDELFTKQYPQAKIQPQVGDFGTYFQKLNVQAASKTAPDVVCMQTRQLADYTGNGVLMPLDDLVKSGQIDVSNIPKSVLDSGRGSDGKLYMIPFGIAWNSLMVDGAMLKKYGIPALSNTYSWTDFVNWLRDAKSKLPAGVAPTNSQGGQEPTFSAYVLANGQKMFDDKGKIGFSKDLLTEYWNNWLQLTKDGLTISEQSQAEEPSQIEQSFIATGKVLSEQTAGNALPAATAAAPAEELTTLPFASGSAGLGNMFFTSGWGISSNSKNTATAAAFINFWTNNDQAASIFKSDNGAVANSKQLQAQIDDANSSAATKQVLQQYQFILGKNVPQPALPAGYNATFEQSFKREYQNVAFGKMTVAQAVDAFFNEANASLGKK